MNYIRQVQTISGTFEKHLSNIRILVPLILRSNCAQEKLTTMPLIGIRKPVPQILTVTTGA